MTNRMKNLLLRRPELIPAGCFPEGDYRGYCREGETGTCAACDQRLVLTDWNFRYLSFGDPTGQCYRRIIICHRCWNDMPIQVRTEEPPTLREVDDIRTVIGDLLARVETLEATA